MKKEKYISTKSFPLAPMKIVWNAALLYLILDKFNVHNRYLYGAIGLLYITFFIVAIVLQVKSEKIDVIKEIENIKNQLHIK